MTCVNPIKNKIQNIFSNWFNMFSIKRKLTDDQMESIQISIFDYFPRIVEEDPFFINFNFTLNEDQLAPPDPIRRTTKPISKIIIFGIEMIFSF